MTKKHNKSIAYHTICEGASRDGWRRSYANKHKNEAYLPTKFLPSGDKRNGFVCWLIHHIFG